MNSTSLRSGTCPKCSSNEVYTNSGLTKLGDRMQVAVSSWKWFSLDSYVCMSCGHFEEHIPDAELRDEKMIEKVKEKWSRVS